MSTVGAADALVLTGEGLTIDAVARVARGGALVRLSEDPAILARIEQSRAFIEAAVAAGQPMYGVTTAFGGMANISIPPETAEALQNNLPWPHKTGTGEFLPVADVRAAMLLRANSLMRGVSGVRLEIIQRLVDLLNAGVTPCVYDLGSIGASGDLVPLSYITGAITGLDPAYQVWVDGAITDCVSALAALNLPRLRLAPKEGLSLINGTSVMSAIAVHAIHDARRLLGLALGAHALFFQAMQASIHSFAPFIQAQKPHPGQIWIARQMRRLLEGSELMRREVNGRNHRPSPELEQDRYSLRCLPQFLGPIVEGLSSIARQLTVEINSATDNPLIDTQSGTYYYCGNFLGQYVGMGMDQLRYLMGLLAKHLDVQIGMLVAPEFNNGLAPSLVGDETRIVNLGLKGLQLTANSIMPLICFYGNSLVDRFPTHAEQFNQNINSQGFGSANLARKSLDLLQRYLAIALMFGVQAVDLRTRQRTGHFDARACLSPMGAVLYERILKVLDLQPSRQRPYIRHDHEQCLDDHIARISRDIASGGIIPEAIASVLANLKAFED
jgi:phenylalanine ammonia-lyase